jgi:hypothetical protein
VCLLQAQSANAFAQEVLKLTSNTRTLVLILLWRWWDERNRVNAGEEGRSTADFVRAVLCCLMEPEHTRPAPTLAAKEQAKWKPPDVGWLKANIDGAFLNETKKGAWGFIIRDHGGQMILAGAGNVNPVHNALMAETMACVKMVEAAEMQGISRIQIETDSSQLREALLSNERDLEPSGMLFMYIREFLRDRFRCHKICNIPRSCNSSVHEIAKLGLCWDTGQSMLWPDDLPVLTL